MQTKSSYSSSHNIRGRSHFGEWRTIVTHTCDTLINSINQKYSRRRNHYYYKCAKTHTFVYGFVQNLVDGELNT